MVTFSLSSLRRDSSCGCGSIHAGISSVRSSKKYSGICEKWESELAASLEVLLGAADGQIAYALDHAHALGDRHGAARVERVEDVRALQRPVVRRKDEFLVQAAARFAFVRVEELPVQIDVGGLEVVLREFVFILLRSEERRVGKE